LLFNAHLEIGSAFAAGNSVVLKPAPQTPLIAVELLKLLLEAGFPERGVNMVLGRAEVGQQIRKDDRVNVIRLPAELSKAETYISLLGGISREGFRYAIER
jgi:acyl-CoA reductase-like NAD-dependent aldehyde dehydrogenase